MAAKKKASKKKTKRTRTTKTYENSKEGKAERFKDFANRRVGKFDKVTKQIGQLANSQSYYYTSEQVQTMFKHLRKRVDEAEARFAKGPSAPEEKPLFE